MLYVNSELTDSLVSAIQKTMETREKFSFILQYTTFWLWWVYRYGVMGNYQKETLKVYLDRICSKCRLLLLSSIFLLWWFTVKMLSPAFLYFMYFMSLWNVERLRASCESHVPKMQGLPRSYHFIYRERRWVL